jgi:hypothetical protein
MSNLSDGIMPSPTNPLLSVGSGTTEFASFENFDRVTFNDCWVEDGYLSSPRFLRDTHKT